MAHYVDIIAPEDSQEGTETAVSAWMKQVGEPVEKDEPLLELSTDKVNIEVAAPQSGRLTEILVKPGDSIEPGQVLGRIEVGAESSDAASGEGAGEVQASPGSLPRSAAARPPDRPDGGADAQSPDSLSGARSELGGQPQADPGASRSAGIGQSRRQSQGHWGLRGSTKTVGEGTLGSARDSSDSFSAGQAEEARQRLSKAERLSPAVRRLVKEHNLDVTRIPGSGRGGRVTYADAQAYLQQRPQPPSPEQQERVAGDGDEPVVVSRPDEGVGHRFVPHTTMRRKIASHMVESMLKTAPHVTAVFEADLANVADHLAANRDDFLRRGAKLTYTAYLVDAAVQALQAVPEINSRWHDDGLEIFADCNIGIAAAVDRGLVVPVIRQAQARSLFGIAQKLQDLTDRARKGKLSEEDMRYGTFTITNHGVSGSLIATPIINQPQSAILGVGKIEKRVVVRETKDGDAFLIRPMAYITLTIDHRALDGFQANSFLSIFCQALQRW
ncbi:MAG TPA: 2-oxo acid dehydrogenase subunit E2 [Acidobacteriota bacterium]|nr:2-oxo acid dehydrogenase subunit E2 [Acidobacteriota bacterium]